MVYAYDEDEWANVVPKDPDWSRQETDYLISMCQQLDLRFLVIADRYEVRMKSVGLLSSCALRRVCEGAEREGTSISRLEFCDYSQLKCT